MPRQPRLDLSQYFPYLINRVGWALVARFSDALRRKHLTIAMWRVLAALSHSGGLRQIDLAATTSIEVSTLSRLITRLARTGLVRRTRSPNSSREVIVELAPKGEALVGQLIPIALKLQQTATRGLRKQELAAVKHALRRMHENLTRSPG